ncbi:MAG: hypothetical protein ACLPWS_12025 [Rhodomicrobium sp.]
MRALPRANFLRGKERLWAAGRFAALCCALLFAGTVWAGEVQIGHDVTKLPPEVQRMRQAILQAAMSGGIEALRVPIEMNEIHPVFAKSHVPDPVAYLKGVSADGNGREILAILYNLLTTGYAIVNPGTKEEMAVWPYHAAIPLGGLTPSQEVEIYRFLPPARLKEMIAQGKYSYYSIGIGRDGVWHYFTSG